MRIMINGQWRDDDEAANVADLLKGLSLDPRRVAVELNKRIVRRANYAEARLAENDQLEIVTLVGGG